MSYPEDTEDLVDLNDPPRRRGSSGGSTLAEGLTSEILRIEEARQEGLIHLLEQIERQQTPTAIKLQETLRPVVAPSSNGQLRSKIRLIAALSKDIFHTYLSTIRSLRVGDLPDFYDVALHANVVTSSVRYDWPLADSWSALLYGSTRAYRARCEKDFSKFLVLTNGDTRDGLVEGIYLNPIAFDTAYAGLILRYLRRVGNIHEVLAFSMLQTYRSKEDDTPAEYSASILADTGIVRGWNFPIEFENQLRSNTARALVHQAIKNARPLRGLRDHTTETLKAFFEEILLEAGISVNLSTYD